MYQVLYRKWRPKAFEDVAGQPQVTVTLKNELKAQRISHAYLFTGSRGTGKTTCAKILAKAVNCLDPQQGDPCGVCEICKGIDEGTVLDISEIDAASNNGVDNIRSIIDEAVFTPTRAKYRVYIIDEVHMLSTGAFNALLKTLEEPPAHVVFILATTEVHKIPPTILSRCQRFDFHRIAAKAMAERLAYVAIQEEITLDEDAALLISAVSDGALRDALSLLDRCMGIDNHVTAELVRQTAGLAGRDHLFKLTDFILQNQSAKALELIESLHKESKDMARLCEELTEHLRSLMLIKTMKKTEQLVIFSDDELAAAKKQSKQFSLEEILHGMSTLQSTYDRMFKGSNKRTEMEVAVIKMASPQADGSTNAILARLEKLERMLKHGVSPDQPKAAPPIEALVNKEQAQAEQKQAPLKNIKTTFVPPTEQAVDEAQGLQELNSEQAPNAQEPQNKESASTASDSPQKESLENSQALEKKKLDFQQIIDSAVPMEGWTEVLDILKTYSQTIAASFKDTDAYISGDYLLIDAKTDIPFKLLRQSAQRDKMRVAVKEVTGRTYKLGPYKKPEEAQTQGDQIDTFTKQIKAAGIALTETGNESDDQI